MGIVPLTKLLAARSRLVSAGAVAGLVLAGVSVAFAEVSDLDSLPKAWAALADESALGAGPSSRSGEWGDPEPKKSYVIPALEIIGFDALLNLHNRYYTSDDYKSTLASIRHNLRSQWNEARDPFATNQLGHPYQGSRYFGFARSAGLGFWESLGYTFAGSALWEIAGEKTPPSRNDQINTGIGGAFLGEVLFRMA